MQNNLNHLAIIMDGNARWAAQNGKTKSEGHMVGAENVKKILQHSLKLGVKYLTLYAFSSENWQRPEQEVSTLIKLLGYYVNSEIETLKKNQIRLKIIGNMDRLPSKLVEKIENSISVPGESTKMTITIAFSYGSRAEIVDACQKIIDSGTKEITEESFRNFLYDPEMPDVDLLIRTSGVQRVSNFLLWQISYAELYFSDKLWPDFDEKELSKIIDNYSKRKRNFGTR
jgi:undecaprenyl diphosphate synthase